MKRRHFRDSLKRKEGGDRLTKPYTEAMQQRHVRFVAGRLPSKERRDITFPRAKGFWGWKRKLNYSYSLICGESTQVRLSCNHDHPTTIQEKYFFFFMKIASAAVQSCFFQFFKARNLFFAKLTVRLSVRRLFCSPSLSCS